MKSKITAVGSDSNVASGYGRKIRTYHPSFKFRVVLESLIHEDVAGTARRYQVNANQLSTWRKVFQDKGHIVFETGKTDLEKKLKMKIGELENLIGKKEIEISVLKKYLDFYAPTSGG